MDGKLVVAKHRWNDRGVPVYRTRLFGHTFVHAAIA